MQLCWPPKADSFIGLGAGIAIATKGDRQWSLQTYSWFPTAHTIQDGPSASGTHTGPRMQGGNKEGPRQKRK